MSALRLDWSVSVDELLPGLVSVTPEGAATVAVLLTVPVRLGLMNTVSCKLVMSRDASVLVLHPFPTRRSSDLAPLVADTKVVPAGRTSLTVAPVTVLGPLLVTVTV